MNATSRTAPELQNTVPVYIVVDGEIHLPASVERCWPHLINYPSWQHYSIVKHLSGKAGGEGELVLLKKEEGLEFPPYLARTVKLEPPHRVIWKTFPQEVTPTLNFFGIVEFMLEPAGDETRFSYHSVYEYVVASDAPTKPEEFQARMTRDTSALYARILPQLQEVVREKAR